MPQDDSAHAKLLNQERRKVGRRKTFRRNEDQAREQTGITRTHKLHALLELGQLIALDLQLNDMLLQISQKACEVMKAERCSIFLYDPHTNELWSTIALGMGGEVIRIPSNAGLAGYCFQTGEIINLEDAYTDERFNKQVDSKTGYRTQSVLCIPLFTRGGLRLGVIQLLNKKDGFFKKDDETFLQTFGNNASVFIEMAQLQKARVDALEESRKDLERLNRAKSKALDHLSHELRTPLAVIQGNIRLFKRKVQAFKPPLIKEEIFGLLEKNLNRLSEMQIETDKIIRTYQEVETKPSSERFDSHRSIHSGSLSLFPFMEHLLEGIKKRAGHREVQIVLDGRKDLVLYIDPKILEEIAEGLIKNAIENTPDEGEIRIILENKGQWVQLKVMDFGIGITKENQRHLFDGLFHTQDTELYTSKKPYDFGAGGKGLDLLQIKTYGQRFGFDISEASQRCLYLPTDSDLCPGKISECPHCREREDCFNSGGSTFCLTFTND
jgi:signal transduction histidine kinase